LLERIKALFELHGQVSDTEHSGDIHLRVLELLTPIQIDGVLGHHSRTASWRVSISSAFGKVKTLVHFLSWTSVSTYNFRELLSQRVPEKIKYGT
jgi:hypothetical protein